MNEDLVIEYFKKLAIEMKYLQHSEQGSSRHFTEMDIVEVDSTLRTKPSWPCLILIIPEIKVHQSQEKATIQFMVVDQVRKDDFADRKKVLSTTLAKAKQILARIEEDAELGKMGMPQVREAEIFKVGPRWENVYGRLVEFEWNMSNSMCYKTEEWL